MTDDRPLMTHRVGTTETDHLMDVANLRDALDYIMDTWEPSEDCPRPRISFPGGFWITYSTREKAVEFLG